LKKRCIENNSRGDKRMFTVREALLLVVGTGFVGSLIITFRAVTKVGETNVK
jgi:hypothetical protein